MRITGGKARGIPLKAPKGDATRPATDRLREAIFSSLGPGVESCVVADLFAGTGSYGLEALSRGAHSATFFENDRTALACLRENVKNAQRSLQADPSTARIVTQDVFSLTANQPAFDLIFLDPPYATITNDLGRIFETVIAPMALREARIVVELPGNLSPEIDGWQILRRIGKSGRDKPTALIYQQSPQ
ncbi:MAG: 16S rRNA (guanine(966)-N(2))-methyltransferase RsmD [Verrucomicrobia bacterium]|jgi:16S rRNA (guanine966-N2)-methyltransferase|nr:16S rRNA (guanine(966)-N(2))-methyltransferase RsmD [Verrucomicrobiota bacterium]